MSYIPVFRVLVLPQTPVPSAFYYVRNGKYAEAYLTDREGVVHSITNTEAIREIVGEVSVEGYDPGDLTLQLNNALI